MRLKSNISPGCITFPFKAFAAFFILNFLLDGEEAKLEVDFPREITFRTGGVTCS